MHSVFAQNDNRGQAQLAGELPSSPFYKFVRAPAGFVFCNAPLACAIIAILACVFHASGSMILDVDYRRLVSRADLTYDRPVTRSEEGMPVGNGQMGSLVWTTPFALKFQINRVDVFAENSSTTSFPHADTDYASGCGYMDINLADAGEDIFSGKNFHQHLSLYDGVMTAQGNGVTARVLAWPDGDVMAVEIEDRRKSPSAINIDLRMLRYQIQGVSRRNFELMTNHAVLFQTAEHTALSRLDIRNDAILLIQEFREHEYYDSSAIAIAVDGRKAKARYLNESTVQLSVPPGKGKFTILISSAATFDQKQDVGALALTELEATTDIRRKDRLKPGLHAARSPGFSRSEGISDFEHGFRDFDGLRSATARWWHDFWARGFVYMHSREGQADFVEQNYTYFLYLMAASSRGAYPPRFGGMLWYTNGDMRRWGSQFWWANTSAYYSNLMPANRIELVDPMFNLYSGMYDSCALAARQQWGSQGIWIPETVFFDGLEKLPDNIASEMQDLFLARKSWESRSEKFRWFAETKNRHNSRWNFQADGHWDHGHWIVPDKGAGPFGHTTHILGAGARIAGLCWQRYQYTLDEHWLRDRAYPIIKGMAEFYRNFPNFKKGDDGKYHIHHLNNGESQWNSSDTPYELTSMHQIFPLAIRAAEILNIDADLRPLWREISDNLVPASAGSGRRRGDGAYGGFVYGGEGGIEPIGPEPELKRRFLGFNRLASFIDSQGIGGAQIFRNRLRLREGPGAIDAEHLGGLVSGIHSTLLDSAPATPADEPVLKLFNAWPTDWDCAFKLLARGGFVVTSSHKDGQVRFVEILSELGQECLIQNPWPESTIQLYRDGRKAETLQSVQLNFSTRRDETILLLRAGTTATGLRQTIPTR